LGSIRERPKKFPLFAIGKVALGNRDIAIHFLGTVLYLLVASKALLNSALVQLMMLKL